MHRIKHLHLGTRSNNMGVIVADSEEGTTDPIWTNGLVQFGGERELRYLGPCR